MSQTYPESANFRWEAGHYTRAEATELLRTLAKQGGTTQRQTSLLRAADRLDEIADDRMSDDFSGREMKRVLIEVAREVGWWARKTSGFQKPAPAPAGHKTCFTCKQPHPLSKFMTTPTVAQAKRYGWRPDTTQKLPTHVCADCRKKKADNLRQKRTRAMPRRDKQIQSPELRERLFQHRKVYAEIMRNLNRARSAINQVKVELPAQDALTGEETTLLDYQFRDNDTRDFYFTWRDMLLIAKQRLDDLLGETVDKQPAPIPPRWGLLLTKQEQETLASLHDSAFAASTRKPKVW